MSAKSEYEFVPLKESWDLVPLCQAHKQHALAWFLGQGYKAVPGNVCPPSHVLFSGLVNLLEWVVHLEQEIPGVWW